MEGPIDKTKISVVNLVHYDFAPIGQRTALLRRATIVGWDRVTKHIYYNSLGLSTILLISVGMFCKIH